MSVQPRKRTNGKTVFYAVFTWQGKPVWELSGSDRREAERLEERRKKEVKNGTYEPPGQRRSTTVAQKLRDWMTTRKIRSAENEERLVERHVIRRAWFANIPLGEVRPKHLVKLVTEMKSTRPPGELLTHPRHPLSTPDEPAFTVTAKAEQGAQGGSVLALDEWPWNRPATTVTADERLAPPGHHEKSFLSDNRGHGPNAVVLSEKAAAILQGFPDGWQFEGKTKIARWAQIGQAMPPPLAEAVGHQIARRPGLDAIVDSVARTAMKRAPAPGLEVGAGTAKHVATAETGGKGAS